MPKMLKITILYFLVSLGIAYGTAFAFDTFYNLDVLIPLILIGYVFVVVVHLIKKRLAKSKTKCEAKNGIDSQSNSQHENESESRCENKRYIENIYRTKRKLQPRKVIVVCLAILSFAGCGLAIKHYTQIPDYLVDFGRKYPEAREFVRDWPKYHNRNFDISVTEEMQEKEIPLFIQWDKRWGYKPYGSSIIGVTGCGPTCLSMVACGLTGNEGYDPVYMASLSTEKGYYVQGVGTSWELMTNGAMELGINVESGVVSEQFIRANLSGKRPIICSMYPGDFTFTGHFIVLTGFDENDNVIVNDPNSIKNSSVSWALEKLLPQIRAIWIYGS